MSTLGQERISVGVDGRAGGWAALAWALHEAAILRAQLHVVHCGVPDDTVDATLNLAATMAPEVAIVTERSDKSASTALLEAAGQNSIAVLGPPAMQHQFGQLMARSTALHVAMRSPCTVVIVHQPTSRPGAPIVVGWVDSDRALAALETGFREAVLRRRPIVVLTVKNTPPRITRDKAEYDFISMEIEPWKRKYPDVDVLVRVLHGRAFRVLGQSSTSAELLILGGRRRQDYLGLRSESISPRLVQNAGCPLMIVRDVTSEAGPALPAHSVSG